MEDTARTISISLGRLHEEQIKLIEERIRNVANKSTNRSEAVQIALLHFNRATNPRIAKLVKKNQTTDKRRKNS